MKKEDQRAEILVVDDSEESLDVLVSIIDEEGFEPRPVTSGKHAIHAARLSPPELILLDVGLPDIDGYKVCSELKADKRTCEIPILFISGLHNTEDKVRALAAGGVDYITKPFQIEEIKARIRTHLAVRQMQRALEERNELLKTEIEVRRKTQEELRKAHDELEKRVQRRTVELLETAEKLRSEIVERTRAQEALEKALHEIEHLKDQLQQENLYLKRRIEQQRGSQIILGAGRAIREVLDQIAQVAPTNSTVLILGETGTGKELVAQSIHEQSRRSSRTMIKVNCAGLPSGIVESELFGRAKGAYTGALTDQPGRFEIADGSTIFLDEIGELPLELQAKLLRVLQDGRFERLGSAKTIHADVRVIAATNQDLGVGVREGRFRQDLFYRLNVFPIHVPPLRERVEDIPALVEDFVKEFANSMGKSVKSVRQTTIKAMQCYPWPGNIRELRNVLERAMILSAGPTLDVRLPDSAALCEPPRWNWMKWSGCT